MSDHEKTRVREDASTGLERPIEDDDEDEDGDDSNSLNLERQMDWAVETI